MKWYSYIICFVLIVVGTFCGIQLFKEVNSKSYINGSIDISNRFSQESFNYTSTGMLSKFDLDLLSILEQRAKFVTKDRDSSNQFFVFQRK